MLTGSKYHWAVSWNAARIGLILVCAYGLAMSCVGSLVALRILSGDGRTHASGKPRPISVETLTAKIDHALVFLEQGSGNGINWLFGLTVLALTPYARVQGGPAGSAGYGPPERTQGGGADRSPNSL